MDRAPTPGTPEEPESSEAEELRRKRLLRRFQGFGLVNEEPTQIYAHGESNLETFVDELWSREDEPAAEALTPRVQQLGRNVLEQTQAVHGFAESLTQTVSELPEESQAAIKPEAERLQEATGNLKDAAEELSEELEALDQEPVEAASKTDAEQIDEESEASVEEAPEEAPEKPKKDSSDMMGMARLVIATLVGGGLGALVGEGQKKEKAAVKAAVKVGPRFKFTVRQQEAKVAAQEAELQQLKATKPEAAPQKEYVKKAAELAEKQTELTHTTVEQVREAVKQAGESETTFKIPERQTEKVASVEKSTEVIEAAGAEKLQEKAQEGRDGRGHEQVIKEVAEVGIAAASAGQDQKHTEPPRVLSNLPAKFGSQTSVYWVLLALATIVALGLIFFSPK